MKNFHRGKFAVWFVWTVAWGVSLYHQWQWFSCIKMCVLHQGVYFEQSAYVYMSIAGRYFKKGQTTFVDQHFHLVIFMCKTTISACSSMYSITMQC